MDLTSSPILYFSLINLKLILEHVDPALIVSLLSCIYLVKELSQLLLVVRHCLPLSSIVHCCPTLSIVVRHCPSLSAIINAFCHCHPFLPLPMLSHFVHHRSSLIDTVHHCPPLLVVVHHQPTSQFFPAPTEYVSSPRTTTTHVGPGAFHCPHTLSLLTAINCATFMCAFRWL